ncbi:Holliday junction branch migration protein RuvA [Candidatus Cerribacteria bacterium 'Amazon FNV 2010 28 9']|uniref:Holliday junction branch migration complex subunit RuvA n=1 Tax=Candidatus Cerribacteria bacterium 'Amazon FNV 2010 28 9' TaxID=2081795 RepID=A0A317JRS5_9BACT|nr:MAG: Holliday junction branch migration protein RuvA [Candidatus Cerribacteria bacterium 'Amazon FNV 2010 28 9']
MIAFLSGKPMITSTFVAVVCGGVGYEVKVTQSSIRQLVGKIEVELFIYSHIKEDCFDLYGFLTENERSLFLKLIGVDGVGPKTALGIMDAGIDGIVHAVQHADVSFFQKLPRVGKKSAQKIIIELKNKLGGTQELELAEPQGKAKEVVEALVTLGFNEQQVLKLTKELDIEAMRVEDAVKKGIQQLTIHSYETK